MRISTRFRTIYVAGKEKKYRVTEKKKKAPVTDTLAIYRTFDTIRDGWGPNLAMVSCL